MPTHEELIFEQVRDIISNQLGVSEEKIKKDTSFTKDLKADSLDVVELIMLFEEQFDISIHDDQAGQLTTVQDVVNYIIAHED